MLEKEVIQHRGFRNIEKDGEIVGFQVAVRQTGYRGAWLSQIRFHTLIVDGVEYKEDVVTWIISGIEYTVEEMKTLGRVMWPLNETAILKVKKPGGLSMGEHEVTAVFGHIASYVPPRMDTMFIEMAKMRPNTRKLLIV